MLRGRDVMMAALRLFPMLLAVFLTSCAHAADVEIRPQPGQPILLVTSNPGTYTSWNSFGEWLRANVYAETEGGRIQVLADIRDQRVTSIAAYWTGGGHYQLDGQRDEVRILFVRTRVAGEMLRLRLAFSGVFRGGDGSRRTAEVRIDTTLEPLIVVERPVP